MRILASLCTLLMAAPLLAQTAETVGGTTTTPSLTNTSKANLIRIDSSALLLDFEMYLSVPGPDTLTFFAYRHPQRDGNATLEWTLPVAVAGGGGAQWYSSGPIVLPLVAGNYYLLGVAWSTTVQYHYTTGTPGALSFGNWIRARTCGNPPPSIISITGSDGAQYYQRFTTLPLPGVTMVGTGCSASQLVTPRLVASALVTAGTPSSLVITNAAPSVPAACLLALGPPLPTPIPLFGCSVWLNLGGPFASFLVLVDGTGTGTLPLLPPPNPGLVGLNFSAQAGVFGPSLDLTNAVGLIVN